VSAPNPFSLEGKRILVTGASSGIGRQIAISASEMGALIVLSGRNEDRLAETLKGMPPGDHYIVKADITASHDRDALVDAVGKLHGVVHGCGVSMLSPIRLISERHIRDQFAVNYEGPILLTQRLLARKSIESGGSILFVASIAGHVGVAGVGVYSGTKAALVATTRCMALELAKHKVRANCLSPGLVATPLTEQMNQTVSLEEKAAEFPLGLGQPEDVANAAIYFMADASRWVTGTSLIMGGPFG